MTTLSHRPKLTKVFFNDDFEKTLELADSDTVLIDVLVQDGWVAIDHINKQSNQVLTSVYYPANKVKKIVATFLAEDAEAKQE